MNDFEEYSLDYLPGHQAQAKASRRSLWSERRFETRHNKKVEGGSDRRRQMEPHGNITRTSGVLVGERREWRNGGEGVAGEGVLTPEV